MVARGCPRSDAALAYLEALGFRTQVAISQAAAAALPAWVHDWRGDWIFCFRSYYILPQSVIDAAAQGAINFHPAPSNFRGRGCLNFALYQDAPEYGVTTHMIEAKVDSGAILRCDRFPILPGGRGGQPCFSARITICLAPFYDIVGGIALRGQAHVDALLQGCDETWSGPLYRLSQLNALQVLECPCASAERDGPRYPRHPHRRLPHAARAARAALRPEPDATSMSAPRRRLGFLLDAAGAAYADYRAGGQRFREAQRLYVVNTRIEALLLEQGDSWPEADWPHVAALLQHLQVWRLLWEDTPGPRKPCRLRRVRLCQYRHLSA